MRKDGIPFGFVAVKTKMDSGLRLAHLFARAFPRIKYNAAPFGAPKRTGKK